MRKRKACLAAYTLMLGLTGGLKIPLGMTPAQAVTANDCPGTATADAKAAEHWNRLGAELKVGTPYWFETVIERAESDIRSYNSIKWCDRNGRQEQMI